VSVGRRSDVFTGHKAIQRARIGKRKPMKESKIRQAQEYLNSLHTMISEASPISAEFVDDAGAVFLIGEVVKSIELFLDPEGGAEAALEVELRLRQVRGKLDSKVSPPCDGEYRQDWIAHVGRDLLEVRG
jgi:hypothetical protein